jgi:bifunctional non-homologous end joining protein LigD
MRLADRSSTGSRRVKYPGFIDPCRSTLVDRPPRTAGWIHEIKFDGYRTQLHLHNAKPKALTRRGNDWSKRFGHLLSELVMLPPRECIIDGEAVVQDEQGLTDFGALQDDLTKGGSDRIVYFAFDLLYLDGHDLRRTPLLERKGLLTELVGDRHCRLHLTRQSQFGTAGWRRLHPADALILVGCTSSPRLFSMAQSISAGAG